MKGKKVFILTIILSCLILTFAIKFINMEIHKERFEVVTSNNSINKQNSKEVNSVVKVIKDQQYQKANRLSNSQKTVYIIVDDKNINEKNIDRLLNLSNDLNLKITFIDNNEIINEDDKIEFSGNTVLPEELDLYKLIENNKLEYFKLSEGLKINNSNTNGIIMIIDNIQSLGENNSNFKNAVKDLKEKGYSFKALD
ncbi:hypothetical protein [Clostridium thermobutyricum]|uniref:Uncharacterized protein n=1 Tax=Clostridium thermobutyricum DSM 4928 TaxID=1121339 RepID=A0A1V4SXD0_9CLOT|nr:hypothetical protein [Clostridium thermobutyricum]OPX49187.1 hypothetical protein CLTHE_09420 [Clostridium thermobutyricum DSM 4928]